MIILKEEVFLEIPLTEELDPDAVLSKIKPMLEERIESEKYPLHVEFASQNILRIYYDKKSLISIQPDSENTDIIIIEDYLGNVFTTTLEKVVSKVDRIIRDLNYI